MLVIQINFNTKKKEDNIDGLFDPPGSKFVFYKIT